MSYGLNIFDATGRLTYSTSDVTWNQVDFFRVPANGSATNTYPELLNREVLTAQMFINAPPFTRKATAHSVSVTGTTITVTGGSEDTYILVFMR
jgi:hypothetical protein